MSLPPPLYTSRLCLRIPEAADAPAVWKLAGDRAISANIPGIPHPYPPEVAEHWVRAAREAAERDVRYAFAMILRDGDHYAGTMTLHLNSTDRQAELGYWVGKPYWGQGLATEAARCLIRWAFVDLDLHRVWARALGENVASHRVLQKAGLRHEGTLRSHLLVDDRFRDVVLYGALQEDARESALPSSEAW